MIYRTFGNTNLKVSAIGMGCSGIGKSLHHRNDKESLRTLCEAFASGINFFDTAPNSANVAIARLLSTALKSNRKNIVISSKAGITFSPVGKFAKRIKPFLNPVNEIFNPIKKNLPNLYRSQRRNNFSKEFIFKTVEGSLKRLQTDYLDLLLLHHPTNQVLESGDFCKPFELLKAQSKIRFYGVSCDSVEQAILSLKLPEISVIQIDINMLDLEPIKSVLPLAVRNNIGVIARLPLAKGLLTNHDSNTKAEIWAYDREVFEERKMKAERLRFLVNENRTMAQTALQFLLKQNGISIALAGFSNRNHLSEIVETIYAQTLTDKELEEIYSL